MFFAPARFEIWANGWKSVLSDASEIPTPVSWISITTHRRSSREPAMSERWEPWYAAFDSSEQLLGRPALSPPRWLSKLQPVRAVSLEPRPLLGGDQGGASSASPEAAAEDGPPELSSQVQAAAASGAGSAGGGGGGGGGCRLGLAGGGAAPPLLLVAAREDD